MGEDQGPRGSKPGWIRSASRGPAIVPSAVEGSVCGLGIRGARGDSSLLRDKHQIRPQNHRPVDLGGIMRKMDRPLNLAGPSEGSESTEANSPRDFADSHLRRPSCPSGRPGLNGFGQRRGPIRGDRGDDLLAKRRVSGSSLFMGGARSLACGLSASRDSEFLRRFDSEGPPRPAELTRRPPGIEVRTSNPGRASTGPREPLQGNPRTGAVGRLLPTHAERRAATRSPRP